MCKRTNYKHADMEEYYFSVVVGSLAEQATVRNVNTYWRDCNATIQNKFHYVTGHTE